MCNTYAMNVSVSPFSGSKYHENADRAFSRNFFRGGRLIEKPSEEPCCICGKGIKDLSKALSAEVYHGGEFVPADVEADNTDAGYMGWYYIGPECAKLAKSAGAKVRRTK